MDRDGRNFLILVGLSALVGLWVGEQPRPLLPRSVVVPSLGGTSGVAPSPIDLSLQVPEFTQESAVPTAAVTRIDTRLDAQFCPPPGESETISYRHTLASWLRRLDPPDGLEDLVRAVRRGADAETWSVLEARWARVREPKLRAVLWGLRAAAARTLERRADEIEALRQAFAADPSVPAFAIEAALVLRHTAQLDEAIVAFAAYQRVQPQKSLARTIALLEVDRDLRQGFGRVENERISLQFTTDGFDEVRARTLLSTLDDALDDAARLTGTPRRERLHAVVYPGREELLAATCVRSWTAAVYDGSLRIVVARGTSAGFDTGSVRHEALHAQAIPFAPAAPRWFHEGLAQLFADDVAPARPHWKRLADAGTWIPAASLEGSLGAIESGDSAELAYAQSLAMVMKLRDDRGEDALRQALQAFHDKRKTPEVLRALGVEVDGPALLEWLRRPAPP